MPAEPALPHAAGQLISYLEMCQAWSVSFQHGMHFHLRPNLSVLLMGRRSNAPCKDRVEENGRVLVYEGHDAPRKQGAPDPKSVEDLDMEAAPRDTLPHSRIIPSAVKPEVWQRDKGQCVICGATDQLHFDHDLPYSKRGTSLTAKNIRLLCAPHNLSKSDKIQ